MKTDFRVYILVMIGVLSISMIGCSNSEEVDMLKGQVRDLESDNSILDSQLTDLQDKSGDFEREAEQCQQSLEAAEKAQAELAKLEELAIPYRGYLKITNNNPEWTIFSVQVAPPGTGLYTNNLTVHTTIVRGDSMVFHLVSGKWDILTRWINEGGLEWENVGTVEIEEGKVTIFDFD